MRTIKAADLFCGAGGASTGLAMACEHMGAKLQLLCVNHWQIAVETHAANHPWAEHMCQSLDAIDPLRAVPGGRLDILWASPECTHHSVARGGKPCSDQSRASAWHILKWASELYIDKIIVENVPEFEGWGPLGANGKPLASRRGETFAAWVNALAAIGYRVEWRVLNAADYGDPTTRRRLFVQASRGRAAIRWPEPTHGEPGNVFALPAWRAAAEIIDWSLPCPSIAERARPLAPNTLRRIEHGIRRYWGEHAEPFLVMLRGTGERQVAECSRTLRQPLPTVTAGGWHAGLVQPFLMAWDQTGGNGACVWPADAPLTTVMTKARHGIVQPFVLTACHGGGDSGRVRPCSDALPSVLCSNAHGIVQPFLVHYYGTGEAQTTGEPLATVTTRDRFGLVQPCQVDIGFRMLQPHELAAAQGFPLGYKFSGNKTEQVKQIGNAVPCNLARALGEAALAS